VEQKFDVIIVGAGPAGSTAAVLLKKFNRSVLLIDKERFPRDKPCGGYLTKRIFDRFTYLKRNLGEITEVPTYGSYFYSPNLSKLEWIKGVPVGYLVLRTKFDNYLKDLAVMKGAEILEGKRVEDLVVNENEAKVILQDGTSYRANLIIGADGVRSVIAEKSQIYEKSPSTTKGLCIVNEYEVPTADIDNIYGNKRATHYFYGFGGIIGYSWVFPKKNHINIGIGGPSSAGRELGCIFPKFLNFLHENLMVPKRTYLKAKFKGSLIPLSTALYLNRSYTDRVLLAGDALGVVSSISGEGIYQSMASGEDAGIIANDALNEEKFDALFLKQYEKIWKKDLGIELKSVANIMQLSSTKPKEELLKKISSVFEKMKEDENFFNFFANSFFGLK